MKSPFLIKASLPATATVSQAGDIPLIRARTVSVTVRLTYAAGATAPCRVHLRYSPDGKNWDTVDIDYFDVDLTAGATVQRTEPIVIPEHGYVKVLIENLDSAQAVTDIKAWYSVQSWKDTIVVERGTILKDTGEEA